MYRKTSNLSAREIKKARAGERRDCAKYDGCLTKAALIDAVCVPCKGCRSFRHRIARMIPLILLFIWPRYL